LIARSYEVSPLICPICPGQMRIIALFLVGISTLAGRRWAYAAAVMYGLILLLLLLLAQRDKLHTEAMQRHPEAAAGHDLAFMKLPVV